MIRLFCFCLLVMLLGFAPAMIEAKCGGGSGRIGFFQRRADHRQLRHEHKAENAARRGSGMGMQMMLVPMQAVPMQTAPKTKVVPAGPVMLFQSSGACSSGSCGTSAMSRRR